jgi:hypothetical protein
MSMVAIDVPRYIPIIYVISGTLRVFVVAVHPVIVSYSPSIKRPGHDKEGRTCETSAINQTRAQRDLGTSFAADRFSWVRPIHFMSYLHLAAN